MDPFTQSNFSGGMNLFNADTGIAPNEYVVGFNIRVRTGKVEPIYDANEDTTAPEGLKQGLYAFDKYLVLFVAGSAYYKNIITDSVWTQITGFAMDTGVNRIYTEFIPQSTNNNARFLTADNQINGTQLNVPVKTSSQRILNNSGGLVVQDGVTQPRVIDGNGNSRLLKTYDEWTLAFREYVPVMRQMKFINGILFGIAPDGTSILRSVSGRPTDFVVNVTTTGDKGGDAFTTNYSVSPYPVTCLAALNSGELFVGTLKTCHPITFNYDSTIFAEPTFLNTKTMAVGVVNHFSFIDTIGDYTFIDIDGLRSFNAVNSDQNEGRTSIFSAKLMRALKNIKQSVNISCGIEFDNYSLYSIITTYGNVIGVYDNSRQVWVSFDRLDLDGPIKQFALADQSDDPTIYAITASSVYKLYKPSTFAEANIQFVALSSNKCSERYKCELFWASMDGSETQNEITAGLAIDNRAAVTVSYTLSDDNLVDIATFNFQGKGFQGWKIQPSLTWQNDAVLNMIEAAFNPVTSTVDVRQAGKAYA